MTRGYIWSGRGTIPATGYDFAAVMGAASRGYQRDGQTALATATREAARQMRECSHSRRVAYLLAKYGDTRGGYGGTLPWKDVETDREVRDNEDTEG